MLAFSRWWTLWNCRTSFYFLRSNTLIHCMAGLYEHLWSLSWYSYLLLQARAPCLLKLTLGYIPSLLPSALSRSLMNVWCIVHISYSSGCESSRLNHQQPTNDRTNQTLDCNGKGKISKNDQMMLNEFPINFVSYHIDCINFVFEKKIFLGLKYFH